MPRVVSSPTTVVKTKDVCIDEFFGGASCNPLGDISFAHVKAGAGWAEEWQAPAFDEYTLILKGSITIESSHGPPTKVKAGQAVFLAKGERVRWVFTEPAEYVPICLPAFSPDNCFREEGAVQPPVPCWAWVSSRSLSALIGAGERGGSVRTRLAARVVTTSTRRVRYNLYG